MYKINFKKNKFSKIFILLLVILSFLPISSFANNSSKKINFEEIRKESEEEFNSNKQKNNQYQNEYIEKIIDYQTWRLNYIKRVYTAHFLIKIGIFILVCIVLISGLYFSYIQFKYSIKNKKHLEDSEIKNISETKLKIGKGSIEITSSIIGLVILIFSVIFFYLYLDKVYPIQNYDLQNFKNNNITKPDETD